MIHGENSAMSAAHRLKRAMDLMVMFNLNETMHQLAMANSVCRCSHVLRRAFNFEVEGKRRKYKETGWGINHGGCFEQGRRTLVIKVNY